ncbi:G-ACD-00120 [African swine fever virus]|uniref:ASFV_Ch_ACD_00120 n=1 Tax=African swine fever virus TaxID=10497 RepID=A0A515HF58_ASF|nr:ASFV_Ch_ACD_00120 [African swine fever virus]QIA61404.1 ASFV_Ch_ACD_00120 [African swine fever virus]UVH35145.1 G-ACD-00120 [African swine fever virus]UVH35327.1 G-ACD-00120 [African swine fever virus]UVH35509.1 G-ACD-00120 [African swine fever virus]
MYMVPHIKKK